MYVSRIGIYCLLTISCLNYLEATCGGDILNLTGFIASPGYPNDFPVNEKCVWKIIHDPNFFTKLDFEFFHLDGEGTDCSKSSKLKITNHFDTGDKVNTFCGNKKPKHIISTSKSTTIELDTVDNIKAVGFNMSYKLEECGGTLRGSGTLYSPFYPFWLAKMTCVYKITTDGPGRIQFVFRSFHIEGQDCLKNSVTIEEVEGTNLKNTKKYCGSSVPNTYFFDVTGYLRVTLKIELDKSSHGFIADYKTDECGDKNITAPIGSILSPMYPDFYEPDKVCVWDIHTEEVNHIRLRFDRFVIKAPSISDNNNLQVESVGNGGEIVKNHGTFIGTEYPPIIISEGNHLRVTFRSDKKYPTSIFKIDHTTDDCGGELNDTGTIYTPFFPDAYKQIKNCIWIINLPYLKKITLQIDVFYVGEDGDETKNCPNDKLSVESVENGKNVPIKDICGWKDPYAETFQKNNLVIKLKTTATSYCLMNISYRAEEIPGLTHSQSVTTIPTTTAITSLITLPPDITAFDTIYCWDPMCDNCLNIPNYHFHLRPCNEIKQMSSSTTGMVIYFCPIACNKHGVLNVSIDDCSINDQLNNFCNSTAAGVIKVGKIASDCQICYYSQCSSGIIIAPTTGILFLAFILNYFQL